MPPRPAGEPPCRGLLATDLDGTLLAPDGTLPPKNLAAIRAATEAGVVVAVVTGRRRSSFRRERTRLSSVTYRVAVSGGAVVLTSDNERVEAVRALSWEPLLDLAHGADLRCAKVIAIAAPIDAPGTDAPGIEEPDAFVLEPTTRRTFQSHAPWADAHDPVPRERLLARQLVHVAFLAPSRAQAEEWEPLLRNAYGDAGDVHALEYPSGLHAGVEVVAAGGKGLAIRHFAQALGLPTSLVAAIGDEMNDAALLDAAGHRFAVGGSVLASRRKDADVVAPAEEGAVGEAISRFLAAIESAVSERGR